MARRYELTRWMLAVGLTGMLGVQIRGAVIKWDAGADNDNWSSNANWDPNNLPGVADIASFGTLGSQTTPGISTVIFTRDETIGGLVFENPLNKFQALDLGGFELTVNGPWLTNVNATAETFASLANGRLTIGDTGNPQDFLVARNVSGGSSHVATMDLTGLERLDATVDELLIGASQSGSARGTLKLSANNEIRARSIVVGNSVEGFNSQGTNRLELGNANVILANEFVVGGRSSTGVVTIASGGTLQLGAAEQLVDLAIGRGRFAANAYLPSAMDLGNAAEAHLFLSNLTVGERIDSPGPEAIQASLVGPGAGAVQIGTPELRGDLLVGNGVNSFGAQGIVDFSGMDQLTAHLHRLNVGVADFSTALGELRLPRESLIDAESVTVGSSNFHDSLDFNLLHLGTNSELLTKELVVGRDLGGGSVKIAPGGSLRLGEAAAPTRLVVAQHTIPANVRQSATVDLRGARSDLFFADITIGEKLNVPGGDPITGAFYGGGSGDVVIGAPDRPASVTVGHGFNSHNALGTLDLGSVDSLTAHLQQLRIGTSEQGTAVGNVTLPKQTNVQANEIVIGSSDFSDAGGTSTLRLADETVLQSDNLRVGINLANGRLDAVSGAKLQLGAADAPMNVVVGQNVVPVNVSHTSTVDLSGTRADLYLGNVLVGERRNAPGGETIRGEFLGGVAGAVHVGSSEQRADFIVGSSMQSLNAIGTVDWRGQDSLDAHVNQLLIGVAQGGTAIGVVRLPRESRIDAQNIVLGRTNGDDNTGFVNAIYTGASAEISAQSLIIGGSLTRGLLTVPNGGALTLGTPEKLMDVAIGQSVLAVNVTTNGVLDASNASLRAHLGTLTIGQKTPGAGQAQGTLLAGREADIHAERIVLADGAGSGLLQFGGGLLSAKEVVRGVGTATFDWSAGELEVDRWGSPSQRFNLLNLGEGDLEVRTAGGTAEIFGDYRQSSSASLSLQVVTADAFDHVEVHGAVELAGTLIVSIQDFTGLNIGDRLPLLSFQQRTGAFSALVANGLPVGISLTAEYDDVAHQVLLVVGGIQGDTNADGQVNLDDLNQIRNNFGAMGDDVIGDLNRDGVVGLDDLNAVRNNFGAAASVPEPASWGLAASCAALALAACLFQQRGKRARCI